MSPRLLLMFAFAGLAPLSAGSSKTKEPGLHPAGFSFRHFSAPSDYNWRGSKDQTLSGVVWYPAEAGSEEKDQYIGPPNTPLFYAGRGAQDAKLASGSRKYPFIALSHGTGGSAVQMAWLGTYLAARGYIVASVNHPGNNSVTGYTVQGFVEGWERAKDISTVISDMLADPRFGPRIDRNRIGAAGFSYGGYTMLELAGARTDSHQLLDWCGKEENACNPPEMPDLMRKFKAIEGKPEIQKALQHAGDSYRDRRIRAEFLIAPADAAAFTPEGLAQIKVPMEIVAGAADPIVPPKKSAEFFAAHIKGAKLVILPGGVGHYTFLDVGTAAGKKQLPQFFLDKPGVDREGVHKQVAEMAVEFFDNELAPAKHVLHR